ncbi:hypothetical protein NL676_022301 [Syzygium grande]|nr:hypothetical protein NL676_022301 [Syzygium grande]
MARATRRFDRALRGTTASGVGSASRAVEIRRRATGILGGSCGVRLSCIKTGGGAAGGWGTDRGELVFPRLQDKSIRLFFLPPMETRHVMQDSRDLLDESIPIRIRHVDKNSLLALYAQEK